MNTPPEEKKDAHIETVLSYFGLRLSYADSYAFTRAQAMRYMETSSGGEMMGAIIRKFKKLEDEYDFTVNRE